MSQLSALLSALRKNSSPSDMKGPGQPAGRGQARGSMGSIGSTSLQWRNSDAAIDKEREQMESPIFQALMEEFAPKARMTEYLQGLYR